MSALTPEWKRDGAHLAIQQDGHTLIVPIELLNQAVQDGTIRYSQESHRFVTTLKGYAWIFGVPYDDTNLSQTARN